MLDLRRVRVLCVECSGKKARAAYAAFKEKYPTCGKRARIIHL
jgi:hypothetical protein